jgi:hypothetical protein
LTDEEKQKRYDYNKKRNKKLREEMRKAGIIGKPRPKMSEDERKKARAEYSKNYNKRVHAEAAAWREMQQNPGPHVSAPYLKRGK